MNKKTILLVLALFAFNKEIYPLQTDPSTRTMHGIAIADPYHWLEGENSDRKTLWLAEKDRESQKYFYENEVRSAAVKSLQKCIHIERHGIPRKKGGRFFYAKQGINDQQPVLYVEKDGQVQVLVDPRNFSGDGTVALSGYEVNQTGTVVAYGVSGSGSDWAEWRFRNVAANEDLPERLEWIKFGSPIWTPDGNGLYYVSYEPPLDGQKYTGSITAPSIYYHRLGESQAQDQFIYQLGEEENAILFVCDVTDNGNLIFMKMDGSDRFISIFVFNPHKHSICKLPLPEARYGYIGCKNETLFFTTDHEAPREKVISLDLNNPREMRTIIDEQESTMLQTALTGGKIAVVSMKDVKSRIDLYSLAGEFETAIALPGPGSISGISGDIDEPVLYFSFENHITPSSIYEYNVLTNESTLYFQPIIDWNPSDFTIRQVFYDSSGGTKIPMFILYRNGLMLKGDHPTLLYGYGGFGIPLIPSFNSTHFAWLELGGILAIPNIRGGGEYGREWHDAGSKHNKQNSFDDFASAARWLIAQGYTNSSHLAISGRSNGGLLTAACMLQNPSLFRAAVVGVGVLDMLKFHCYTGGKLWVSDYGDPENPQDFHHIYKYSPYHNVIKGTCYPATLITTADHDDRVVPMHSYKFAAALQEKQGGSLPILLRVYKDAGHGAGKSKNKQIEEAADLLQFLYQETK